LLRQHQGSYQAPINNLNIDGSTDFLLGQFFKCR